jgi:hypothetical protein
MSIPLMPEKTTVPPPIPQKGFPKYLFQISSLFIGSIHNDQPGKILHHTKSSVMSIAVCQDHTSPNPLMPSSVLIRTTVDKTTSLPIAWFPSFTSENINA